MAPTLHVLEPGDVIEIKYRLWRTVDGHGEDVVERWLRASITSCDRHAWPLARLADGQSTEIRPFMTWRWVARIERRAAA